MEATRGLKDSIQPPLVPSFSHFFSSTLHQSLLAKSNCPQKLRRQKNNQTYSDKLRNHGIKITLKMPQMRTCSRCQKSVPSGQCKSCTSEVGVVVPSLTSREFINVDRVHRYLNEAQNDGRASMTPSPRTSASNLSPPNSPIVGHGHGGRGCHYHPYW